MEKRSRPPIGLLLILCVFGLLAIYGSAHSLLTYQAQRNSAPTVIFFGFNYLFLACGVVVVIGSLWFYVTWDRDGKKP